MVGSLIAINLTIDQTAALANMFTFMQPAQAFLTDENGVLSLAVIYFAFDKFVLGPARDIEIARSSAFSFKGQNLAASVIAERFPGPGRVSTYELPAF